MTSQADRHKSISSAWICVSELKQYIRHDRASWENKKVVQVSFQAEIGHPSHIFPWPTPHLNITIFTLQSHTSHSLKSCRLEVSLTLSEPFPVCLCQLCDSQATCPKWTLSLVHAKDKLNTQIVFSPSFFIPAHHSLSAITASSSLFASSSLYVNNILQFCLCCVWVLCCMCALYLPNIVSSTVVISIFIYLSIYLFSLSVKWLEYSQETLQHPGSYVEFIIFFV